MTQPQGARRTVAGIIHIRSHAHSARIVLAALPFLLFGCGKGPPSGVTPVTEIKATESAQDELPVTTTTDDWAAWRGPTGDGRSTSPPAPTEWNANSNIAWMTDIPGRGHSSPIVVGDLVILASAVEDREQQLVAAFSRTDGSLAWSRVVHEGAFPDRADIHPKGTYANSTVSCDGERLFVTFLNGGQVMVSALDLGGKILWQKSAGGFSSKFGFAPSPVLYQSLVIVAADNWGSGFIAALHRATGEIVWRKQRPSLSSYSSPLITSLGGKDQLLLSGCRLVASFNPLTGELLWQKEATAEATCGTPVTDGNLVFASGGYPEQQTVAMDATGNVVWQNRNKAYEPSMLVVEDRLLAVTDDGIAHCWSTKDGSQLWRTRLQGSFSASPVLCQGLVYVTNLDGTTFVFRATEAQLQEVSRNRLGNDCYTSFAVSRGQLFGRFGFGSGRDRQEKLVCIGSPQ
ncbi:MAG: PQQ-binding-like beta-propeller repeat protein [Planctomycetaceae bacterium]|nr:PQQ-binding-like beta-propeller repeat protein [Planctomycetaceae bacterium]